MADNEGGSGASLDPAVVTERTIRDSGAGHPGSWQIAAETAVEIGINGQPLAVMMASPADLEDLAVGFAYTERLLVEPAPAPDVTVNRLVDGIVVDIAVAPERVDERARRNRLLEGRAGCGLCGVDSLAAAVRTPVADTVLRDRFDVADVAVRKAFDSLADHQPLNLATHSVHAAAWCDAHGGIVQVREDVGRHNALDKLVGAMLRGSASTGPGFVIMTSRLSFELVCKAAAIGASMLATASAPTTLALDVAARLDLPVACLGDGADSRRRGVVRFPEP